MSVNVVRVKTIHNGSHNFCNRQKKTECTIDQYGLHFFGFSEHEALNFCNKDTWHALASLLLRGACFAAVVCTTLTPGHVEFTGCFFTAVLKSS